MYIRPWKNPNSVFDIYGDFQNLKRIREEENTAAFYNAVNELMDKYGNREFSMDDILPEKALFESLVFNLQDNLRTVVLLANHGCKVETYSSNLKNMEVICQELRNLKWKYYKEDHNEAGIDISEEAEGRD